MAVLSQTVIIPYRPRPLQLAIHQALDRYRFGAAVCHRRFGKTVCAINHLQKAATSCTKPRPRFAYIAPTYSQGKAIAWDYMKHYAAPIPGHTVHESELRIDYPDVGQGRPQVRIYGADNPDSLRGIYLDGVVLDEYGLMRPSLFSEVLRPALSDREGWAFFIGTPNGKNQFYDVVETAKDDPNWFAAIYKASETGILNPDELHSARQSMTADEYAQEYECSFEASVKGAVFARELQAIREQGRITRVPYDPALPVDTDWDLGVGDATAIWFSQSLYTGEVRLIDYYEASGEGLQHYREVLNRKGYTYGVHWAPHDIEVRELGVGRSRLETARALGLNFRVTPKVGLDDGVHAARMLLPRCWFDSENTKAGIEALQSYRWDYNTRIHEFKPTPVHDWASHAADAFRGCGVRHTTPRMKTNKHAFRDAVRDSDEPHPSARRQAPRFRGRAGY
jgi:phage terminase large subunit